ncbi:MAG TPA: hypothetical protein H9830_13545 [Candidatus Agrococcus pullicola]|uniref:Uncharacterized protein n=1 Tax=Candidatus Agrococcus pullicola TaxID=2838429 RepID=A0A9D1YXV4_9MICO|nr:hypothetical protein [Candidatus Agrococcus pullicola]
MQRINNVLRVHFADRKGTFLAPVIVVGIAMVVIALVGIIATIVGAERDALWEGMQYNGAVWTLLGIGIGIGFATMGQHLSFALGMGITRREWAIGSGLMFVIMAASISTIVVIGKVIEIATGGWGMGVRMFDTVHTSTGPWWQTAAQTFLIALAGMCFCAMIGAVWNRWGKTGLSWLGGVMLILLVLAFGIGLITPWEQVLRMLEALVSFGWGGWMSVLAGITVVSAIVWAILTRRAEVR